MNMDLTDTKVWLDKFEQLIKDKELKNNIILAPSNPYLDTVFVFTKRYNNISLSAQNVSCLNKGAHTGSTGVFQLKDFCEFSIIGHSERREDRNIVIKKRNLCLENKITPIVCFVDSASIAENSTSDHKTMLAWEDPKNISKDGEYRAQDPSEISEVFKEMRSNVTVSDKIIYGGSVNRDNAKALSEIENIDGVLVGNASLDPEHFFKIIEIFE